MFSIIIHILFKPISGFFLGIGGLCRWCFFQFLNIAIEEKYPKNIEYYVNNKSETVDINGFTVAQKNMFISFVIIIISLILIEKFG